MVSAEWDGSRYRILLTDLEKHFNSVPSFLVELERPDATLRLLDRQFSFEQLSHFHVGGRWYVYSPRKGRALLRSTVILRDLQQHSERTLVEGNAEWAFPRFYRDALIYTRSNGLWQISLTGTNAIRLFPH